MLEMWEDGSEYCTAIVNGTASTFGLELKMELFYMLYVLWLKIIIKLPFSFHWLGPNYA